MTPKKPICSGAYLRVTLHPCEDCGRRATVNVVPDLYTLDHINLCDRCYLAEFPNDAMRFDPGYDAEYAFETDRGRKRMPTVGRRASEVFKGHPSYDPVRPLADNEVRCPECGYIIRLGSAAELAHDAMCDLIVGAPLPGWLA